MKKLVLLILLWFLLGNFYAQNNSSLGVDCNPKLNDQEISYLSKMFSADNYDFKNKTIGFASYHVNRLCKIQTVYLSGSWPIDKKEYFTALAQDICNKTVSKLLILNTEQKKESGGFDAIVLIIKKKKAQKVDTKMIDKFSEVFGYRTLNYPNNLHLVGNDNNEGLTAEDAIFFNQIYHYRNFDFKSKKIAFMNPHLVEEKQAVRTKKEYIEIIKKHLEDDFLYPTDELIILNEQEKQESGGYDAIIVYQTKRSYKDQLIQILKESSR